MLRPFSSATIFQLAALGKANVEREPCQVALEFGQATRSWCGLPRTTGRHSSIAASANGAKGKKGRRSSMGAAMLQVSPSRRSFARVNLLLLATPGKNRRHREVPDRADDGSRHAGQPPGMARGEGIG